MHRLKTSTVWLHIARSAFTGGFFQPCKATLVVHYKTCGATWEHKSEWCGVKCEHTIIIATYVCTYSWLLSIDLKFTLLTNCKCIVIHAYIIHVFTYISGSVGMNEAI